jgi:hypothetical protein
MLIDDGEGASSNGFTAVGCSGIETFPQPSSTGLFADRGNRARFHPLTPWIMRLVKCWGSEAVLMRTSVVGLSCLCLLLTGVVLGGPDDHARTHPGRAGFDEAMRQAMQRMDRGMALPHTGNPDRDFATMMIPHHQGAIDMAKAELEYGKDPVLRRLAQGIIVEQQQEIEVMRRELERLRSEPATRARRSQSSKEGRT